MSICRRKIQYAFSRVRLPIVLVVRNIPCPCTVDLWLDWSENIQSSVVLREHEGFFVSIPWSLLVTLTQVQTPILTFSSVPVYEFVVP